MYTCQPLIKNHIHIVTLVSGMKDEWQKEIFIITTRGKDKMEVVRKVILQLETGRDKLIIRSNQKCKGSR